MYCGCFCNADYTKPDFPYINFFCFSLLNMKTVLITGGTGMLGTALSTELVKQGYGVIILTRSFRNSNKPGISYALWDVNKGFIEEQAIQKADYIVHLAGANLAVGRWTKKRKKVFTDSRVKTGALLVNTLRQVPNKVLAVISASAIGYYGADEDGPGVPFIETDAADHHFLGNLVQKWEDAVQPVASLGKRLVILRFGIILSKDGGAFREFQKPLSFGLCTILGNGKQIVSWIHISDAVGIIIHSINQEKMKGVYNAVSPFPVSNEILMKSIARNMAKKHICISVPSFALKLGLGEMSIEVLKSATVSSEKIIDDGYRFQYPDINSAIQQLVVS